MSGTWEKVSGRCVDYVQVSADGVCVGRHFGSGASDNAGRASHAEFLGGTFQELVAAAHGEQVLAEVIAAVRTVVESGPRPRGS